MPVYISEITPSEYRGALSTCFDMSINFGILLGYVAGFLVADYGAALTDDATWRVMLGLGAVLPAVVLCGLAYLPESPRWLMARGRRAEAAAVLTRFLGDAQLAAATLRATVAIAEDAHIRAAPPPQPPTGAAIQNVMPAMA